MAEETQNFYTILLDVQKQIGNISRETGEQTEIIKAINIQTTKTNGRVTVLESSVQSLELVNANNQGKSTIRTALFSAVGGVLVTVAAALIAKRLGL